MTFTYFNVGEFFLWSILENLFFLMVLWNLTKGQRKSRHMICQINTVGLKMKCYSTDPIKTLTHLIIWFPIETLQLVRYLHAPQLETIGKWEKKWSISVLHSMQVWCLLSALQIESEKQHKVTKSPLWTVNSDCCRFLLSIISPACEHLIQPN